MEVEKQKFYTGDKVYVDNDGSFHPVPIKEVYYEDDAIGIPLMGWYCLINVPKTNVACWYHQCMLMSQEEYEYFCFKKKIID